MTVERYRLSFTTGGLFLREAPIVAERYLTLRDWIQTRDEVRTANLLQVRTATAALRISKELVSRLEHLNGAELAELIKGSLRERAYLFWSATSRQYVFSIAREAVSTAAFVLENAHKPAYRGAYLRLVDGNSEAEKMEMLAKAIEQGKAA